MASSREQREAIVSLSAEVTENAQIARRAFGDDSEFLRSVITGIVPVLATAAYREAAAIGVALQALGAPIDVDATFAREMGQRRWSLLHAAMGRRSR